ncbi:DUF7667 family protein [Paludifilum halophilum]|uniref:Uncharacterized protein n=1 Tax=Paludifilum halophilum TaxID=1642702 RepID=A0A235B6G4_9BACL|nr:hypothetical protein [Paludifilum halophilum]OYD07894.1 hypothetical protein CHM34_07145 [Paludifilum halophilum]
MLPTIQRLAMLRTVEKKRPLTKPEQKEMDLIKDYIMNRAWKIAFYRNLTTAAFIAGDAKLAREANEKLMEMGEGGKT